MKQQSSEFFEKLRNRARLQGYTCVRYFSPTAFVDPQVILLAHHGLKREPCAQSLSSILSTSVTDQDVLVLEGDNFLIDRDYVKSLDFDGVWNKDIIDYKNLESWFFYDVPALKTAFEKAKLIISKDSPQLVKAINELSGQGILVPNEEYAARMKKFLLPAIGSGLEFLTNRMFIVQSIGSILQMPHIPFFLEQKGVSYAIFCPESAEQLADPNISGNLYSLIKQRCSKADYKNYSDVDSLKC